jgi:prepilin-type N-terminal cleavage/methylation domain-containing protein
VKSTKLEQLRKRLLRNNQKGFTLIELLVVVSILGILAAVVTMSLVGIEGKAKETARTTELATVQAAFDTDVHENGLDASTECGRLGDSSTTANHKTVAEMTNWPGSAAAGEALYPNFVHTSTSSFTYFCQDQKSGTLGNN